MREGGKEGCKASGWKLWWKGTCGGARLNKPKYVDKRRAALGFEDGDLEHSGSWLIVAVAIRMKQAFDHSGVCAHSSCITYLWHMVWFHMTSTER